jgi:putative phosphoribosyl transferase
MFRDRVDAAEQLVVLLHEHDVIPDVVVAIPRGGVPIGNRIAEAFGVPLVVLSVKKVGAPFNPEFALGAVTDGGVVFVDAETVEMLGIDSETVDLACEEALTAAKERSESLNLSLDAAAERIRGKSVVVVDDGLATGSTVRACCRQVHDLGATSHVVAVPVAAPDSVTDLQEEGCAVLAVETPPHFAAVGQFYESFPQVDDETVREILEEAESRTEATV